MILDNYCNPEMDPQKKPDMLQQLASTHLPGMQLQTAIQLLGAYIVSENDQIRSRSYQILFQFLQVSTTVAQTNGAALSSVCKFFADRMHDFEGMPDLINCVYIFLSRWASASITDAVAYLMTQ